MPGPPLQDFMLPLSELASDGRDHTQKRVINCLAEHLKLTEFEDSFEDSMETPPVSRRA